jgi:hypothetical protein
MGDIINQLDRLEEIMRALTAKVGDVDQQQQAFNIALIHLEQGHSADALPPPTADSANSGSMTTPSHRRHLGQWSWPSASSPPPHRHRGQDTKDDLDGEPFQTSHKIEFPKFDGTSDPLLWLNHCERYFCIRGTHHKCVPYASFYLLDDSQLWYHRHELNGGSPRWDRFVHLINKRFGTALTESSIGELTVTTRVTESLITFIKV